jgi:dynein heavy chain
VDGGSFTDIFVEELEESVSNMFRIAFKLIKVFQDQPVPKKVAESVKNKLEKFKQHLPLISVLGNKGLRDRHWKAIISRCQCHTNQDFGYEFGSIFNSI